MDLMKPVKTHVKVLRAEQIEYEDEMKSVYVIDYTMDLMGGLTTTEWLGHDGTAYRMEIGLMGMKMVLAKTDMQTALGESGEVDVILNTKIFAQGKQPRPNSQHFKARLRLTEGDLDKAVMRDSRQKLRLDRDPRSGILEIAPAPVDTAKTLNLPFHTQHDYKALQQFLKDKIKSIKAITRTESIIVLETHKETPEVLISKEAE